MKISKSLLPAAALVALFAGCQDEDFGYQSKDIKYQSEFKKLFGEVDPNQDWSMAKQITATYSGTEEGVLEIFYKNPISSDAVLLAKKTIVGGTVSVKFDMAKNVNRVFARINKGNGYYPINGYFNVVDGKVNIGGAMTRAEGEGECRVTKGEAYSIKTNIIDFETWGNSLELYTDDAAAAEDFIDGYYRCEGNSVWRDYNYKKLVDFTNIIPLNNVLSTADERPEIFVSDIAHFFVPVDGEKPLFTEKENHVKFMKPGSVPQLQKDLIFTMSENGPMYLDYFFKGTKFNNKFGYFYFKGDIPTPEQFIEMPKYILVDNMSTDGTAVSNYVEGPQTWDLLKQASFNAPSQTVQYSNIDGLEFGLEGNWDNKIIGTRFQLTYFGEDGTGDPTYTFPEGTKIGLFIEGRDQSDRSEHGQDGIIITSVADLNLKLYSDCPHAALFRHNGQVVFAMEDMWNGSDYDLNDMMFFVNAPIDEEEIPELVPPVEPKTEVWIAACEDLGGSYDYDFNDFVFGLQKVYTEDESKCRVDLIPLAAGGILNDVIMYNGQEVGEVHSLLGGSDHKTALNVSGGSAPEAGSPIVLIEEIDAETSINEILAQISVKCNRSATASDANDSYNVGFNWDPDNKEQASKVPEVILLPQGWDWPAEEVCILDVYPAFNEWVKDASNTYWNVEKNENANASDYVTNPLKPVVPVDPVDPSDPDSPSDPDTPSETVGTTAWNITLVGPATVEINGTAEYSVVVKDKEGNVMNLSDLTITAGSYSPGVASFEYKDGKFIATGKVFYDATIYVKVAGNDTYRDTRKEMHISVVRPEWNIVLTPVPETMYVGDVVDFTATITGQDALTDITFDVEDEEVIALQNVNGNTFSLKALKKGKTTLSIYFPADDAKTHCETTKKYEIEVLQPTYGTLLTTELGEENGASFYKIDLQELKTIVPSGGVILTIVGEVNQYYHSLNLQMLVDMGGYDGWQSIGKEGAVSPTRAYATWELSSTELASLLSSKGDIAKLSVSGVSGISGIYVKSAN